MPFTLSSLVQKTKPWQAPHALRCHSAPHGLLPQAHTGQFGKGPRDTESSSGRREKSSELLGFQEHHQGSEKDHPQDGADTCKSLLW